MTRRRSQHKLLVWRWLVVPVALCLASRGYSQTAQPVAYSSGVPNQGWANTGWNNPTWNGAGWNSGTSPSSNSWKLGVTGNNTDVGVSITSVAPNSAGARAGLAPGDLIICVNGDQVGLVGTKVFDISEELNHHADSAGRVRLTAQQRLSPQVRVLNVQLDDQQGGLTGSLILSSGTLPPNSIITVQLENMTRPYYVVRNGQQSFPSPPYAQGRIPYSINFDPAYVFPTDAYRVRATVTVNGAIIFETPQPPLVLTQGKPSSADVYLSPPTFAFSGTASGNTVAAGYAVYDANTQQITAAYQRYLGRAPTTTELAAWQQFPSTALNTNSMQRQFLGSQEYFDRTGNNNLIWMESVFREITGRAPTSAELDQWMRRYANVSYSRSEILKELSAASGR